MLEEFQPDVLDKEIFCRHYGDSRIEIVIEDMGWVSEAYRALRDLELDTEDTERKENAP